MDSARNEDRLERELLAAARAGEKVKILLEDVTRLETIQFVVSVRDFAR